MSKYLLRGSALPEINEDNEAVSADQAFADLYEKYGKVGTTVRGLRYREDWTQEDLAKKLKVRQTHISEMEHGKRSIGKAMAKKLGALFNIDYRLFL